MMWWVGEPSEIYYIESLSQGDNALGQEGDYFVWPGWKGSGLVD